jgi:hypothetical protein
MWSFCFAAFAPLASLREMVLKMIGGEFGDKAMIVLPAFTHHSSLITHHSSSHERMKLLKSLFS